MTDKRPTRAMEHLATELVVEIFKNLKTASDVHSLMLTSRALYRAYAGNANYIAKSHIFRYLAPDDYKLGVMAIESRKVNPLDQVSLKEFFDDYVHHDEWNIRLFRMYTAFHLPELVSAVTQLVNFPHRMSFGDMNIFETATEFDRRVRAYYMQEIAVNLFHHMPESDRAPLARAPYGDWVVKYWANFSPAEIAQVVVFQKYWCRVKLFEAYEECKRIAYTTAREIELGSQNYDSWHDYLFGCKCRYAKEVPKQPVSFHLEGSDESELYLFSELAGVRKLHRWHCPSMSSAHSMHDEYEKFKKENPELLNLDRRNALYDLIRSYMRQAQELGGPRFHPDPKSTSDEVWKMNFDEWKLHTQITNVMTEDWVLHRVLWDKSTIKKLRRIDQRGYYYPSSAHYDCYPSSGDDDYYPSSGDDDYY
ncbi:hypothetical protein F5Y06DRAFT_293631 [Hypoxylon sp. FL0890]|nr:hypothetical protein F5Y06DRAFT_293631 [Hypoxylon sp. FL0890]